MYVSFEFKINGYNLVSPIGEDNVSLNSCINSVEGLLVAPPYSNGKKFSILRHAESYISLSLRAYTYGDTSPALKALITFLAITPPN